MTALLEMNTSPAETEQAERKQAMRFQYASGSRPLEGYTIKRGVGRGGFGEVYFAVSDAGKEVALKLIRRNLEVELRGVTHCLNLKHPNLIDVYDIRTDEHDDRWVIMEYVSGASLEDVVARYPDGMPQDMALHWFEGICGGVAYLHDHGIVHRDLKPANIFLDEGRVKIGDYGLSKFISCSRRSGQTESVGTVHYMAPEIANGRYGREIDSYALGIILYEMLTGRVPFEGESVGEVLMKHLTAEPDLSRLEEPFRGVVRAAMAKDPERRIDNAAEMAAMVRGTARPAEPQPTIEHTVAYQPRPRAPRGDDPPDNSGAGFPPYLATGVAPEYPRHKTFSWREFIHSHPDPLAAGVRRGWRAMVQELNYAQWNPGLRVICTVGLVLAAIFTFPVWIVIGFSIGVWYFFYLLLRLILQAVTTPPASVLLSRDPPYAATFAPAGTVPTSTPTPPAAPVSPETPSPLSTPPATQPAALAATLPHQGARRTWRRRGQGTWRQAAYAELAARPLRDRVSTLLASMLAASVIAPVASLLVCLFSWREFQVELFLWAAIVGTLGSWALMAPAQLFEGRVEDQAPMRFIQLLLGALVGAAACGVAEGLYLQLPVSGDMGLSPNDTLMAEIFRWENDAVESAYHTGAVQMPLPMYAAYFAFLFVLVRWWKQAEWTRSSRVSLWSLAWCAAVAGMVGMVWWFPQPLGVLSAMVISFTVQLASPWLSPTRRKEMANPRSPDRDVVFQGGRAMALGVIELLILIALIALIVRGAGNGHLVYWLAAAAAILLVVGLILAVFWSYERRGMEQHHVQIDYEALADDLAERRARGDVIPDMYGELTHGPQTEVIAEHSRVKISGVFLIVLLPLAVFAAMRAHRHGGAGPWLVAGGGLAAALLIGLFAVRSTSYTSYPPLAQLDVAPAVERPIDGAPIPEAPIAAEEPIDELWDRLNESKIKLEEDVPTASAHAAHDAAAATMVAESSAPGEDAAAIAMAAAEGSEATAAAEGSEGDPVVEVAADPASEEIAEQPFPDSAPANAASSESADGIEDEPAPPRPEWVSDPPKLAGPVQRIVIEAGPCATLTECHGVLRDEMERVVLQHVQDLASEWLGRPAYVPRLESMRLGNAYIVREFLADQYVESVQSPSFGEMKTAWALLEFDQADDARLLQAWQGYARRDGIAITAACSAPVLAMLGLVFGLIKVDTWTRGYYTKRLFIGVPAAIIAVVMLLGSL